MVGAGKARGWQDLAGKGAQPAFHPVADDGSADFLGDGEADTLGWIAVGAVANEEDEARTRRPAPGIGGEEVGALADRG